MSTQEQPKPKHSALLVKYAEKVGLTASEMGSVLMATIMPGGKATIAQVHALLIVADEYTLSPMLKEIHAFPDRSGGIRPIVGVDGWLKIANRHEQMDGLEFEFIEGTTFDGKPDWGCKATLWRKDRGHPTVHTAWLSECKRNTDPWNSMVKRMLENRATCQVVRRAFGITGIMDPDEAAQAAEFDREREARKQGSVDVEATVRPEPAAPATADERMDRLAGRLRPPVEPVDGEDQDEGESSTEALTQPDDLDVREPEGGWPFPMRTQPMWVDMANELVGGKSQFSEHTWAGMTMGEPEGGRRKFMQSVVKKAATSWDRNRNEPSDYAILCAKALAMAEIHDRIAADPSPGPPPDDEYEMDPPLSDAEIEAAHASYEPDDTPF